MAASDCDILYDMWRNPHLNLTTWCRHILDMLKDDDRYKAFCKDLRTYKNLSVLHRAFYYAMKSSNIGLKSGNNHHNLSQLRKCLRELPDHHAVQLAVASCQMICNQYKYGDDIRMLLSESAYQGNKTAINLLATSSMFTDSMSYSDLYTDFDPQSMATDPFYTLGYYTNKLIDGPHVYSDTVDAMIGLDMPLNGYAFQTSVLLCRLYIEAKQVEEHDVETLLRPHFIRLWEYISPAFTLRRSLPRQREPFNVYFDEHSREIQDDIRICQKLYETLISK